ncbi:MAG: HEAT repeat domain-containing protein [Bdellovibrionota bacterium]
MNGLARESLAFLKVNHAKVINLFQANFYFFYEEQFLPGVKKILNGGGGTTPVKRLLITVRSGQSAGEVLFDSSQSSQSAKIKADPEILKLLGTEDSTVLIERFDVRVFVPSGMYGVLYFFDGSAIAIRIFILFALSAVVVMIFRRWWKRGVFLRKWQELRVLWRRYWRLKAKFIFTIIAVNIITASIVFVTLSSLQSREQAERLKKELAVFGQFSTTQVVSAFSNHFYFQYAERFVPEIKRIIASNENLLMLRIISARNNRVLFDSEQAFLSPSLPPSLSQSADVNAKLSEMPASELPADLLEQVRMQGLVSQETTREGERLQKVIILGKGDVQKVDAEEPLFFIEYVFSYRTLNQSIASIRRQVLIDLIPSTALGLIVAVFFAQLLLAPIRRLVIGVQKVTSGDYDVSVDIKKNDEIGELVSAFNAMTSELRKKKELRKYLSDSTYRQIMAAPDSPDGAKIGGQRVSATILFSDIRDFVAHCEHMDAEEVTAMLNEYFSEMVDVVYKYGGEVDKFIGDALLAVFYTEEEASTIRRPAEQPGYDENKGGVATALKAIYCGLEMRDRLAQFNKRRESSGRQPLEIGVGITHGEIISGPIGSKDRMDFTVIGDVVNLANRIEKLSKHGKYTRIVFSGHVEEKVRGLLDYSELSNEKIRGKEESVLVYELIGVRDLDVLINNLRGGDVELKRRSIELLGQSRNQKALPQVMKMLRDNNEWLRLCAAGAVAKLAQRDSEEVLEELFHSLKYEGSEKVISAVISTIGKICTTDRVLGLIRFLSSSNERIIANVVEAMGQVRSPKCIDMILPLLSSRNNRIKANAAMALFAAGHLEVIGTLKPMLMHSDALMRSSAAFALGELTMIAGQHQLYEHLKSDSKTVKLFMAELQECVPMLVQLLKDVDLMVQKQAVVALGKIKDKSAVLPIIEMIDPHGISKDLARDIIQSLRAIGSPSLVRSVVSQLS